MTGNDGRGKAALALAALLVALGALLRLSGLDLIWTITDQTRDLTRAFAIASGREFPLLGPAVGPSEFCLGPLYYYLLSIPALVTRSPVCVFLFASLVNIAALWVFFLVVRRWLWATVAVLSLVPYALAAPWVIRAQMLSNPTLMPLFVILFWACVMECVVDKRSSAVPWAVVLAAVLLQLHLSTAVFIPLAILAILLFRPPVRACGLAAGGAAALAVCLPYLYHEYRHGWGNTLGLLDFICGAAAAGGPASRGGFLSDLRAWFTAGPRFLSELAPGVVAWYRVFLSENILAAGGAAAALAHVVMCLARRRVTREARVYAVLLIWLGGTVAAALGRRGGLWLYYLDAAYPAPFVFFGIFLSALWRVGGMPTRVSDQPYSCGGSLSLSRKVEEGGALRGHLRWVLSPPTPTLPSTGSGQAPLKGGGGKGYEPPISGPSRREDIPFRCCCTTVTRAAIALYLIALASLNMDVLTRFLAETAQRGVASLPSFWLNIRSMDAWAKERFRYLSIMPMRFRRGLAENFVVREGLAYGECARRLHGPYVECFREDKGYWIGWFAGGLKAALREKGKAEGSGGDAGELHYLIEGPGRPLDPAPAASSRARVGPFVVVAFPPALSVSSLEARAPSGARLGALEIPTGAAGFALPSASPVYRYWEPAFRPGVKSAVLEGEVTAGAFSGPAALCVTVRSAELVVVKDVLLDGKPVPLRSVNHLKMLTLASTYSYDLPRIPRGGPHRLKLTLASRASLACDVDVYGYPCLPSAR